MPRTIPIQPRLPNGLPVEVYWNLHKHMFSVRHPGGTVLGHFTHLLLDNVNFKVYGRGRQRVLTEGRKNVHAFIRGTFQTTPWSEEEIDQADIWRVRYNPYEASTFLTADASIPVFGAGAVTLTSQVTSTGAKGLIFAAYPRWAPSVQAA